jgi:hypothetical protein
LPSIADLIKSSDPLSDEAARVVVGYREETTLIDFKVTFVDEDEKWLDVTKDVMAFANTEGGYLVFGVKDKTFEAVGLGSALCVHLADTNNWLQKLNRYVEPNFTGIRCRALDIDGKSFTIVFVPPSVGHTHVVSKDAVVKGTTKVVLRQGTFFVRRTGGVHLADARDLDAVLQRRLEHARASWLGKFAQVMAAPPEAQLLMVKKEKQEGLQQTFVVENAPSAIAVKGQTFNIAPKTAEEAVQRWIGMTDANAGDLPSPDTVWKWYRNRHTMNLTCDEKLRVAAYSLLQGAPFFFWLQGCPGESIKEMLVALLERKPDLQVVENVLGASAFLGKRFFQSQVTRVSPLVKRLGKKVTTYADDPHSFFPLNIGVNREQANSKVLEEELDQIAKLATASPGGVLDLTHRWRAEKVDCFLYAQDDQYK